MINILGATDTTSKSFASGGVQFSLMIDTFVSGIWTLEALSPAANWITMDDKTFKSEGLWTVYSPAPGVQMRLTGGGAGAQAWVYGAGVSVE